MRSQLLCSGQKMGSFADARGEKKGLSLPGLQVSFTAATSRAASKSWLWTWFRKAQCSVLFSFAKSRATCWLPVFSSSRRSGS